ncbi:MULTISPECIES: endonuclease Q family protein [unclassified Carboxydocella]|uniref:endonuclease Q family protein n=1 Tax=unclassified Carboxydocella TaxID=2685367 RepID=UPI0009AC85F0|nr:MULTISPECIES: endonuclease Q family protein [unclassified Carboxydocella]GAW27852.1 hypothetical protein ULO1_04220 [Carboxydocella sp. ULO1]GAW32673.1 hypothetical protein JDF658_24380 [Carboxydocella sp. JDF658]
MRSFYADLHIHLGATTAGRPVKITASRRLTLPAVLAEAAYRKGLDIVGIIDAQAPGVLADLKEMIAAGDLQPLPEGGLLYRQRTLLVPGAEVESREGAHFLAYFPGLEEMEQFSTWLAGFMRNLHLSSQRAHLSLSQILQQTLELGGLLAPAHAFTPHKGLYGCACASLGELLTPAEQQEIRVLELGLSADTAMAERLAELARVAFLSNSDAHSLEKIGREYNELLLAELNWREMLKAFYHQDGRRIIANWGLDPRLGKYHRSACADCGWTAGEEKPPVTFCPACGSKQLITGVLDRLVAITTEPAVGGKHPPYYYQVPLQFLPGIGKKTMERLLSQFGTEMAILHQVPAEDLIRTAGEKIAALILACRQGQVKIQAGGGGTYGRILQG